MVGLRTGLLLGCEGKWLTHADAADPESKVATLGLNGWLLCVRDYHS